MKLFKVHQRNSILALVMAVCAVACAGLQSHQAYAASSYVQGSYAAAMKFGSEFCSDFSSNGVGPSQNGVGDLVWITALDGSTNITANQGDLYAPVTVHIAGRFCDYYNGSNAGSNYTSDQGGISGQLLYGGNQAGTTFNVSEPASLYIGNFGAGTHRINMSLASFFTLSDGSFGAPKDSPNAWTDLTIKYTQKWTINGQSYVDNLNDGTGRQQGNPAVSASPGQTLDWDHDMRNNGPNDMDRTVYYNVDRTGFNNGWDASHVPTGDKSGVVNELFVKFGGTAGDNTKYTVVADDGGRTLCQRISWKDKSWDTGGAWGSSGFACASVPYDYNLIPAVTGPNGMGSVGSKIPPVTPKVNNELPGNAGKTTRSPDTVEWQLKRIEVDPGGSIPMTQQENGTAPCTHYNNGGANSCVDKGSGTQSFPAGSTTLAMLNNEMIDANTPVGTRICFTLSVRPYSQANGNWRHSVPVCITVSKQPKLQVWGGDVRTRGSIETGTTIASSAGTDKLFGSWVEYGGFSVGGNSGFASGSGLNNGNTSTGAPSVWNKLTFANVNASGTPGNYGLFMLPGLPTLSDQFIGPASGGAMNNDLSALGGGTYVVGSYLINGGTVGQVAGRGKTIIIVSSGTITIDGNITYAGPGPGDTFSSISQLPQVIIIAKNINIKNSVTQIDAWLLTTDPSGAINTCSDRAVTDPLNSKVCTNRLTVNGPVVTQHLHLRRTAGSDTVPQAGDPAEVFNLRPDTYLWAQARASQAGKAQTVYSVELPPRF
jgi:hypothetical protein